MNIKVALGFEVLVTERASKSSGIVMNSHVFFEIITFLEAISTKWAGKRFISRIRSTEKQPIQDVFGKINERINSELKSNPSIVDNIEKLKL